MLNVIFLLSSLLIVTSFQEDPTANTCSNAVIVLTKDDRDEEGDKTPIIAEACAMEKTQQPETCSNTSSTEIEASIIQKLDETSTKRGHHFCPILV